MESGFIRLLLLCCLLTLVPANGKCKDGISGGGAGYFGTCAYEHTVKHPGTSLGVGAVRKVISAAVSPEQCSAEWKFLTLDSIYGKASGLRLRSPSWLELEETEDDSEEDDSFSGLQKGQKGTKGTKGKGQKGTKGKSEGTKGWRKRIAPPFLSAGMSQHRRAGFDTGWGVTQNNTKVDAAVLKVTSCPASARPFGSFGRLMNQQIPVRQQFMMFATWGGNLGSQTKAANCAESQGWWAVSQALNAHIFAAGDHENPTVYTLSDDLLR